MCGSEVMCNKQLFTTDLFIANLQYCSYVNTCAFNVLHVLYRYNIDFSYANISNIREIHSFFN